MHYSYADRQVVAGGLHPGLTDSKFSPAAGKSADPGPGAASKISGRAGSRAGFAG